MRPLRLLGACLLIFGSYFIAVVITPWLPVLLPVPLVGMAILFVLLSTIKQVPAALTTASRPLLHHMALFFIPAVMGIWQYRTLIQNNGLALFLAVVCSTLVAFVLVAILAQRLVKRRAG